MATTVYCIVCVCVRVCVCVYIYMPRNLVLASSVITLSLQAMFISSVGLFLVLN